MMRKIVEFHSNLANRYSFNYLLVLKLETKVEPLFYVKNDHSSSNIGTVKFYLSSILRKLNKILNFLVYFFVSSKRFGNRNNHNK